MIKKIAILLLLIPTTIFAAPGLYIQAEGGLITSTGLDDDPFLDINIDPTARLSLGYLLGDCNFNFGLEAGGTYYRASDQSTTFLGQKEDVTVDGSVFDLLAVAKYTFNSGFNVFAKAGGAYITRNINRTITSSGIAYPYNGNSSVAAPELAVGLGYQLTPHWGISLTGNALFNAPAPMNHMADAMIGVSYRFG